MRRTLIRAVITAAVAAATVTVNTSPASAVVDKDCGDFDSQRAAQIFYLKHGGPQSDPHRLDADDDGIACDTNPAPYYRRRTLPDAGPKPEPKPVTVRSTVELAFSRSEAITGERLRLTATVKPRAMRTVLFQRQVGRRWSTLDRDQTNGRGRDSLTVRAPRATSAFRAVLVKKKVGNKTFTADTSPQRTLRIQKQAVRLDLSDDRVAQRDRVRATAIASPVRANRQVSLQVRRGGRWVTLSTARQNRKGRASFPVPTQDADHFHYRAVALRSKGAAPQQSQTRELTVVDATAPATPTGVVVTPADAAADVSWNVVSDRDPVSYVVRYRPSGAASWLEVDAEDTWVWLSGLANDIAHEVQVRSLDPAGNRSPWSVAQEFMPTAGPVLR